MGNVSSNQYAGVGAATTSNHKEALLGATSEIPGYWKDTVGIIVKTDGSGKEMLQLIREHNAASENRPAQYPTENKRLNLDDCKTSDKYQEGLRHPERRVSNSAESGNFHERVCEEVKPSSLHLNNVLQYCNNEAVKSIVACNEDVKSEPQKLETDSLSETNDNIGFVDESIGSSATDSVADEDTGNRNSDDNVRGEASLEDKISDDILLGRHLGTRRLERAVEQLDTQMSYLEAARRTRSPTDVINMFQQRVNKLQTHVHYLSTLREDAHITCNSCTYANKPEANFCAICEYSLSATGPPKLCCDCTSINIPSAFRCRMCGYSNLR